MRWFFLPLLLLAISLPLLGQSPESKAKDPVTVILMRHAETTASTSRQRDPALSEQGGNRAKVLAKLLSRAGVSHLYASEFKRTQATLAPLATVLGKKVEVVPAENDASLLKSLHGLAPGSVAVVCGHSNTVPKLVKALGGEITGLVNTPPYGDIISGKSYDRLFLVTLAPVPAAAVKTVELSYGK